MLCLTEIPHNTLAHSHWTVFSGSSARKTVQWTVFRENRSADPRRTGRQTPAASQGICGQQAAEIHPSMCCEHCAVFPC